MKNKILVFLLVVTSIMSLNNVKAYTDGIGYLGLASISIPKLGGVYTSSKAQKTEISDQYVLQTSAIAGNSSNHIAVNAKINGIGTSYVTLTEKSYTKLNNNGGLGQAPGEYQLDLKQKNISNYNATFYGIWLLDESKMIK